MNAENNVWKSACLVLVALLVGAVLTYSMLGGKSKKLSRAGVCACESEGCECQEMWEVQHELNRNIHARLSRLEGTYQPFYSPARPWMPGQLGDKGALENESK